MEKNKTSSGIDENLAGALCYLASLILSFLAGILFLLIEKENKFVRFHAIQSIGFNIAGIIAIPVIWIISMILVFIPIIGWILIPIIYLIAIIVILLAWVFNCCVLKYELMHKPSIL